MTRIFAAHLLNDYSGSPKVLSQLLRGWIDAGYEVHLRTSTADPGFLSGIAGLHVQDNHYRFHQPILVRLLVLMACQLLSCLAFLASVRKEDVVYINTMLPFGAAIAGKLKGAKVIYHLHETSVSPEIFKRFLLFWVKTCATEVIYVSNFLAHEEPVGKPSHTLYNAIGEDFREAAESCRRVGWNEGIVLMVASLKAYKGVDEMVAIARQGDTFNFELVVNASRESIEHYFAGQELPDNLTIHPAQKDVHPFYRRAAVVMNLSRPEEWKETFGLTALEGMIYGAPVIVPPAGGIAEIVRHFQTGFHIRGTATRQIIDCLERLRNDPARYESVSRQAADHAATFSEARFISGSLDIIEGAASLDTQRKLFQM